MINRIVELAAPTTYEIDGHTYSSESLSRIDPPKYMPKSIEVNGLDSVCKLVRNEVKAVGRKIFIQIQAYNTVRVFSTYDDQYERSYLYKCTADTPSVTVNRFNPYEYAVIELRSLFIPNKDTEYLLQLLSSISSESSSIQQLIYIQCTRIVFSQSSNLFVRFTNQIGSQNQTATT